jgi:two-component system nitrate/nitrite response regulator NarL
VNRVLIAIDDLEIRESLRAIVCADSSLELVGAVRFDEAIEIAEGPNPADVVLLSPSVMTLERLTEHRRPFRLAAAILVTRKQSDLLRGFAARANFAEYIDLEIHPKVLGLTILNCAWGASPLTKSVDSPPWMLSLLTPQEVSVLQCIDNGMTNEQAAEFLGLSSRAVKETIKSILRKLDVKDLIRAITIARRFGYLN